MQIVTDVPLSKQKKNPVEYAEVELGVHEVWEQASHRLEQHEDAKDLYLTSLRQVRNIKADIRSAEMDLASDERGKFPEMKVTPFRDHMKAAYESDERLSSLRADLAAAESSRDEAKADMDHHSLGVHAMTARMHELAGLLQFYSAAKLASKSQ